MNKNKKIAERKIDKEVNRRTRQLYIYHIKNVSRKINGITIASNIRYKHNELYDYVIGHVDELIRESGIALPHNVKHIIESRGMGISICDYRDQFDHNRGRRRAKRSWLRTHPRLITGKY